MPKLFMLLIGCRPPGRNTEQHDVFFSIGDSIRDILPQANDFWPQAGSTLHLDAWREVNLVNGYQVWVTAAAGSTGEHQLFFINLGGYKQGEFEEFHYKMLVVAKDKADAIKESKQTAFYKHTGFKGATSHIDDKYGVDVDDLFAIPDILPLAIKKQFSLQLTPAPAAMAADELHLGYFKPVNIDKWAPTVNGNE